MTDFIPMEASSDMTWPDEIQHFSASSLGMALRCPEQWRQRYVQGKKSPPSLALISGTADHRAIGANFQHKIEHAEDMPVGEVVDRFLAELEDNVEQHGGLSEIPDASVSDLDMARMVGQKAVRMYRTEVCPGVLPVAVEEEFSIQVPGLPVPLIGFIDLRTPLTIVDRKTARRAPKAPQPEWRHQAGIYQLARPLPFEWHVSVKAQTPSIITGGDFQMPVGDAVKTQRLVAQVFGQMAYLYQRFGPDDAWPTTGTIHTWACQYCGWRKECIAWR